MHNIHYLKENCKYIFFRKIISNKKPSILRPGPTGTHTQGFNWAGAVRGSAECVCAESLQRCVRVCVQRVCSGACVCACVCAESLQRVCRGTAKPPTRRVTRSPFPTPSGPVITNLLP